MGKVSNAFGSALDRISGILGRKSVEEKVVEVSVKQEAPIKQEEAVKPRSEDLSHIKPGAVFTWTERHRAHAMGDMSWEKEHCDLVVASSKSDVTVVPLYQRDDVRHGNTVELGDGRAIGVDRLSHLTADDLRGYSRNDFRSPGPEAMEAAMSAVAPLLEKDSLYRRQREEKQEQDFVPLKPQGPMSSYGIRFGVKAGDVYSHKERFTRHGLGGGTYESTYYILCVDAEEPDLSFVNYYPEGNAPENYQTVTLQCGKQAATDRVFHLTEEQLRTGGYTRETLVQRTPTVAELSGIRDALGPIMETETARKDSLRRKQAERADMAAEGVPGGVGVDGSLDTPDM